MLQRLISRAGPVFSITGMLVLGASLASCGGGDSADAPEDMVLLEFLLVDRGLVPVSPTGTQDFARNGQILLVFSEDVSPLSVTSQTVQIRFGPQFQSVPTGSFSISGNTVRFDPTVDVQGQPNPFGFQPVTRYTVDIPAVGDQEQVVSNIDNDPNQTGFFTDFLTSDGFLRELVPPQVLGISFQPAPDLITGNIPGNGTMLIEFSEPMWPGSFVQGPPSGPDEDTTIDIRYTGDQINVDNGVGSAPVPGSFTANAGANVFFFRPTFSWGDFNANFTVEVFQGLRDLAGNLLVNPQSFGPYTCDGLGIATGKVIEETFTTTADRDFLVSDADWGQAEEGTLRSQDITSRNTYLFGYTFTPDGNGLSGLGQYAAIVDPLIGADINELVSNINPPSNQGRRVMWALSDTEMGPDGSVTKASWGPDSNATFAAVYPNVILRMGFQKNDSLALVTTFDGNYDGAPARIFEGEYSVSQAANVGNTPGHPVTGHVAGYQENPGCVAGGGTWNAPLFSATGFVEWPEFSSFFEWDDGNTSIENDSVFLFDASVEEGDTFQQIRGWFAVNWPCAGVLLGGFPNRRLRSTYEDNEANPTTNFTGGILNPEPSIQDVCFEITKRVSIGQSLFYFEAGNPVQAAGGNTFGALTDYLPPQLTPSVQEGGSAVKVLYQGADLVEADRRTINQAGAFTPWTEDINDCDGFAKIRFQIQCIANLDSAALASVQSITIPMVSN